MEVIRQASDLEREVWRFWIRESHRNKIDLVLDEWAAQSRETKRHKWRHTQYRWSRISTDWKSSGKPPTVPADVAAEALELARSRVAFSPGAYGWNGDVESADG